MDRIDTEMLDRIEIQLQAWLIKNVASNPVKKILVQDQSCQQIVPKFIHKQPIGATNNTKTSKINLENCIMN
jgi:hypothetical protein